MSRVKYATKEDVKKIIDKLELIEEMLVLLIPEISIEEDEREKITNILKKMEEGKEQKLEEIWNEI